LPQAGRGAGLNFCVSGVHYQLSIFHYQLLPPPLKNVKELAAGVASLLHTIMFGRECK
jgi:hypothetical protein